MAILAVACALVFLQLSRWERQRTVDAKRVAASMVTSLFAASVASAVDFVDADAAEKEIGHLAKNESVLRAAVWSKDGAAPLARSGDAKGLARPETTVALETTLTPDEVRVRAPVVGPRGTPIGIVAVDFSLAVENAAFAATRTRLLLATTFLALVVGVLLLVLARTSIVRPLERLAAAAATVEAGQRAARVDLRSNDEIGRLARAWNAMSAAVEDRERRLSDANRSLRELFDHMRQAIVVFGPDGHAGAEQSRFASQVFGGDVRARPVVDLLYPDREPWDAERSALEAWIPLAFAASASDWDEIAELAPREAHLRERTTDEAILELELRPIVREGTIARILLLATDVTEERKLEGLVKNQEERHARQIATMRRLVGGGSRAFVDFLGRARARLRASAEAIERSGGTLSRDVAENLFRDAHTLRGEAHAFEIADLASAVAALEARLVDLRGASDAGEAVDASTCASELRERIDAGLAALDRSERLFVELSPAGKLALEQVLVRRSDLDRLGELVKGKSGELAEVASRLAARPFGEIVHTLVDRIPVWAERDKKEVRAEIDGREHLVRPHLAAVLPGVLAHLVRNAIAHGIEEPSLRERATKPARGTIRIACHVDAGRESIEISDDGRGIDGAAVLARAAERGMSAEGIATDDVAALVDLVARGRISTRPEVDALAGRGVGLAAARADLATAGYLLDVRSERGTGTTFVIRPTSNEGAP